MPREKRLTSARKAEHLHINLEEDVQSKDITTGLEDYYFLHQALPEIDLDEVDLSMELFGKPLKAPLVISSMTGGTPEAQEINHNLAKAAQKTGVALGVGSQRSAIEKSELATTYQVRHVAPDILLLANLGAVQLNYGYGPKDCQQAVDMIEADALVLHLNPLHEALQPEGNTNFSGLLRKIEEVCRELTVPVIAKEVGWGISRNIAQKLAEAGVAGIDTAGAGGTAWSEIESRRAGSESARRIARAFRGWGIPTAESIIMSWQGAPGVTVIASGGIRTGVDAAKALALGADAVGIAAPMLKAAAVSAEAVEQEIGELVEELRLALFSLGLTSPRQLKHSPLLQSRRKE